MSTVQEITSQEQLLKSQLAQLEQAKVNAANEERQQKIDSISNYENDAISFRNQAEKANTDDDKKSLYSYADDADQKAFALRQELGLVSENEQFAIVDKRKLAKLKAFRNLNSLLIKAAFSLLFFFITDFTAGKLDTGFFTYVLQSVSQILYFMATAFGGAWLVCSILFYFVSSYISNDLERDFKGLKPSLKIAVLVALIIALLHFLNAVVPHAI